MRARKPTSLGPEASPETAKRLGWTNFATFPIPSQYELLLPAFLDKVLHDIIKSVRYGAGVAQHVQQTARNFPPGLAMHCLALLPSFPTSRCPNST